MKRFRFVLASLALCLGIPPAARAETGAFRFDELAKVQRLGSFSVSPDGRWIAYGVGTPDVAENRTRSAIWIVSSKGGTPKKLTVGDTRDSDPAFSPDGKKIAFLSNRDGSSQIYLVDVSGGEAVRATAFPTQVNGFRWTPDGRAFVITSDVFPECPDPACNEQRLKERDARAVKARVAERLLFRHWDAWKDGMRTHIWKLPAGPGAALDLTPGDRDAPPFEVGGSMAFDVSRDGKELVFASNPDRAEALSTNWDLWMRPLVGPGAARNLTEANKAYDGSPKFSPDGRWIAYRAQKRPGFEADRFELMILDRATGRTRSLTPSFDYWVEDLAWAPDSLALYFSTHVKGKGALYRVDLAGGTPEELWSNGTVSQFALSPDSKQVFLAASSLTRPPEIFVAPSRTQKVAGVRQDARRLTRLNDELMSQFPLSVSSRAVQSADGKELQAWVVNPPGFDPQKKYPAILLIHGGPQSAWTDSWSYRWNPQVFAGYGYVVYAANPRGSTSFGQEFTDQISNDWGGRVYEDLMRQTDDLVSLPYVDKERVGAAGASYGGYMIAWIAGHTDRFKALVCHDGVIDTGAMGLETEELWFTTWDFGGWPWKTEATYEKWNPLRFADNFKTPTLVVSNEKDYRVPFGQGLQFFTALQVKNVASRLLTFPDEGHWVLKPGNSRVWHAHVMDWFHRYLGGADPDPEALDSVYSVTR